MSRGHKPKPTHTPNLETYVAWIPDTPDLGAAAGESAKAAGNAPHNADVLTAAERAWLAAQGDLARAPDYWRPVRWLELGERMYREHVARTTELDGSEDAATSNGPEDAADRMRATRAYLMKKVRPQIRPLHHGVLLVAWDAGEWRFPEHEFVGRVGVPWGEWVQSEEGRAWRLGTATRSSS
jgi:hypothetical protein